MSQGCLFSPYLFNLYVEHILRETSLKDEHSCKTGGRNINSPSYADGKHAKGSVSCGKKSQRAPWNSGTKIKYKDDRANDSNQAISFKLTMRILKWLITSAF